MTNRTEMALRGCDFCDAAPTTACGNGRCEGCCEDMCVGCCEPTLCQLCDENASEWGTSIGGGGELTACDECVSCHAADRMEPGVTWTRLDGKARQTDGLVMIGGAA